MPVLRILLFAWLVHANAAIAAPRLVIEDAVLDFGAVRTGSPVEQELHLKNTGDTPLRIERVALTPPLRVTAMPAQIAAGAMATLRVSMDPAPLSGRFAGKIVVMTDDPEQAQARIAVTAHVVPPIEVTPMPQLFLAGVRGDHASAALDIVNHEAQPLRLSPPEHVSDRFTSRLDTIEEGQRYRLTIALRPDAPGGKHTDSITIATTSNAVPVLAISAHTWLRERVHTFPDAVDLGAIHVADIRNDPRLLDRNTQTLMVYQAHGHAFEASVTTDIAGLDVRAARGPDGDRYQLTLALRADAAREPRTIRGHATITTNDPEFPRIVVPVTGEILP